MNYSARNCPRPLKLAKGARRRLDYHRDEQGVRFTHAVLVEACQQHTKIDVPFSDKDVRTFDELFASMSTLNFDGNDQDKEYYVAAEGESHIHVIEANTHHTTNNKVQR